MISLPVRSSARLFATPIRAAAPGALEGTGTARVLVSLLACALFPAAGSNAAESSAATPYRLQLSAGTGPAAKPTEIREPYHADPGYRLPTAPRPAVPAATAVAAASEIKPFAEEVSIAARDAGVEPALVHAVIEVESAYRANAVSPKGALGLMQVMPATAQRYGISNAAEVRGNLLAGTRHLRTLIDIFGDRLDLVLAAYNAGEGAVRKYNNAIPPYAETRNYVPAVMRKYKPSKAEPVPPLKVSLQRDYMPGTRLDANALLLLAD